MSFIPMGMFLAGGAVLGFTTWLLDGILDEFISSGISETGDVYSFIMFIWTGVIVAYVVFGGLWAIRKYNEKEYGGL